MSVFTGGDKYYNLAKGMDAKAYNLEQEIGYMESNRSLLAEIRKARLANQELIQQNYSDIYAQASGADASTANVLSTLGGSYAYSMDLNQLNESLEQAEIYSNVLKKKGATADKRAATATQITMAVLAVAGGALGAGLIGAGIAGGGLTGAGLGVMGGAAIGKGAVSAMKPGKVARSTSTKAAVQYGITGATLAIGGAIAGSGNGTAAANTTKGITDVTGQAETIAANSNGQITMPNAYYGQQAAKSASTNFGWLKTAKDYISMGSNISSMLQPDYSYVDERYQRSLYTTRARRLGRAY